MIFCAMGSSMFAAFFACFGEPTSGAIQMIDFIMEIAFIIDLLLNFLTQYTDPREPDKPVKDLMKICLNYIRGNFFFDFLAVSAWPIIAMVRHSW